MNLNAIQFTPYALLPGLTGLACLSLGLLVYINAKKSLKTILFLINCILLCLWLFSYALCYCLNDENLAIYLSKIACSAPLAAEAFIYHFIVVFLNLKKERKFVYFAYLINALTVYYIFSSNIVLNGVHKYFFGYYCIAGPYYKYALAFFVGCTLRSTYLVYREIKRNTLNTKTRLQAQYILYFFPILYLSSIDFLPKYHVEIYPFGSIFALIWLIGVAYAILKHQLLDIKFIVRKSLIYSILITVIVIIHLAIVVFSEKIFQSLFGYQSIFNSVIAATTIAIIFLPLRNIILNFVDKYFFKGSTFEIAQENEKLRNEIAQTERLKAIATLASGMAHEIKNPLTAIKTFSEHLPKKLEDKEFLIKFGQLVGKEVNRVDELVHQLLEFARPAPLSLIDVDLHKLLNEILELQNSSFIERHITVIKNFDANIPLHIDADANQLKQAFLNLILNAIEAMSNGGSLTVGVRVQGLGDRGKAKTNKPNSLHPNPYTLNPKVSITIKDTGTGIDKEAQKHIFEPFYSNKDHGTGLGLSITYGIIQEHHGNLSVESHLKKGTKFTINLPLTGANA